MCSSQSGGDVRGSSPEPRGTQGGATSSRRRGQGGTGGTPNTFASSVSKLGFVPMQAPGSSVAGRLPGRRRPTQLGGGKPEWTVGEALRGMEVALAGVGREGCFGGSVGSASEDDMASSRSGEDSDAGPVGRSKRRRLATQPSSKQCLGEPKDPEAHALLLQLATTRGWTLLRTARTLMGLKPGDRAEMVARLAPAPLASTPKG